MDGLNFRLDTIRFRRLALSRARSKLRRRRPVFDLALAGAARSGHFVEAKRTFPQIGPGQADLTVCEAPRPHLAALAAKQKLGIRTDHLTTRSRASGWHAKQRNLRGRLAGTAKRSQASGGHAKTRNLRFRLAGAATTGLRPQKPEHN